MSAGTNLEIRVQRLEQALLDVAAAVKEAGIYKDDVDHMGNGAEKALNKVLRAIENAGLHDHV